MDEKQISDLFIKYKTQILWQIAQIVKNKEIAEDLLQDTFIKIIEKKEKYNEELGQFNTWAVAIAKNLSIDFLRKNKKMTMVRDTEEYEIFDIIPDSNESISDKIIKKETDIENAGLLKKLSRKEEEIIRDRIYGDMSYEEISKKHNAPLGTIKGTIYRAKIGLQQAHKIQETYFLTTTNPTKHSPFMSESTENNISALRKHLFEAIRKLEGGTMKADEAKAMASLAQTIINSAKLELEYKTMIEKQPDIKMLNE